MFELLAVPVALVVWILAFLAGEQVGRSRGGSRATLIARELDEARREAETMRYWATRPSADLPVADYRFPWEEVDSG